ncbi:MAG TPA: S9 family peptidase [Anaerolineae bacterium]
MPLSKQPITIEDLYLIATAEDPHISPDGERVAFTLWTLDKAANKNKRAIWIVPTRGGPPRPFTSGEKPDHSPRWSPDGKTIAFVSSRDDRPQIYLIDIDGGEARRLTAMPNGAVSPAWSPGGKRIAFLSFVNTQERRDADRGVEPPDDPIRAKVLEEQRKKTDEGKADPRVHDDLPYRTGTDYFGDRRSHIYVVDVEGGKPIRLTDGDRDYAPPAWSPDGRFIYSTAKRNRRPNLFLYQDIVRVPAEPGRARPGPMRRYRDPGYSAYGPDVSPDGKWIAYVRVKEDNTFAQVSPIAVRGADGRGRPVEVTAQFDRSPEAFEWTRDSRSILFTAGDHGETPIWKVNRDGGKVTRLAGGRWHVITGFSRSRSGRLAFAVSAPDFPRDVFVSEADGSGVKRLTRLNDDWLKERHVIVPKEIRYTAPDGWDVQGFVHYPPGFSAASRRKYPMVVEVHGGPQVMWSPAGISMWHELNVMAGAGYVTFWCNPRGSDGYGTPFARGLVNDWGASMPDILAGMDKVIATGRIDARRICLTGGSYGGWATAWIIGHTDRFAAAASLRGVYNLVSFDGTTDINDFIRDAFGVYHWNDHETLWRQSPLAHTKHIHTPLLILHAEQDYRAPIPDAEQLFAALKRLGRKVQFVRYPREGHEQTRSGEPKHRVDSMQRILDWFEKHGRKR